MRAAIRGDFERLERRLGGQELMQVREPEPEPEPPSRQELAVATEAPAAPEVPPVENGSAEPSPKRSSWLARLLAAIPPRQV